MSVERRASRPSRTGGSRSPSASVPPAATWPVSTRNGKPGCANAAASCCRIHRSSSRLRPGRREASSSSSGLRQPRRTGESEGDRAAKPDVRSRSLRRRSATRAMNTSGIVMLARWSRPLPGRTTSRRNHAEMPALAPAAPSAGLARSRNAASRARRGASATKPTVPATPPTARPRRARRSPRIAPRARRGGSWIGGRGGRRPPRSWRGPRPRSRAGPSTGSGAEPPFQRRGERHGAAAERDEPRRHHVWIVRILRGEPTDVLVPELVLVLTALCDQPGRGERGGPERPAERPETIALRHADIVEVRPCGPCGESPTGSCG